MIPLILGFSSAALFLGLAMSVYGTGALIDSTWVAIVFFGLLAAGLTVYAINRPLPAWLCRLLERAKSTDDPWHAGAPCGC